MQAHQLLHILEPLVERQFHAAEEGRHHLLPDVVVVMERPSHAVLPSLGAWLAHVVEQCGPTQPEPALSVRLLRVWVALLKLFPRRVLSGTDIVQHLERMVEVVLMGTPVSHFHAFECRNLGQDKGEQPTAAQFDKSDAGHGAEDNLVQLVDDALLGDNLDALGIAAQGLLRLVLDTEVELRGKADAAHHAQGIVGESDVGVERCGDKSVLHIQETVETIYQFAEAVAVETDGQGIDGEVPTVQVVLQRAVLHDRLTAVVAVALAAGTHELDFKAVILQLCCSEIAEHTDVGPTPQPAPQCLGHRDAGTHDHTVDVLRGPLQEEVAHIAPHHIAFHTQRIGRLAYLVEDGGGKQLYHLIV